MAKKGNSATVKCDVYSCEHCNCKEGTCSLKNVIISCSCANDNCLDNKETICQSFKSNDKNIKL